MMDLQKFKIVNVASPQIVDNASVTVVDIDRLGFHEAFILFKLGATDVALSALKIQDSDDDSTYVDVTSGNFTAPGATDDNKMYGWFLDLRGFKRYIRVIATVGDGTIGANVCITAFLARADTVPNTATLRGLDGQIILAKN